MYIWVAIDVNEQVRELRENAENYMKQQGLSSTGVIQHDFDKDFLFHTSVIVIHNEEQIGKAFDAVRDINIPEILRVERFIIGSSTEGRPGTYSVVEEIEL